MSSLNGRIFVNSLLQYLYYTHTKTHICVHKKTCERMYTETVFTQLKLHTIQIAVFRRMGKLGYCDNERLHSTENGQISAKCHSMDLTVKSQRRKPISKEYTVIPFKRGPTTTKTDYGVTRWDKATCGRAVTAHWAQGFSGD